MAFNALGPLYPKPAFNAAGVIIPSQSLAVSVAAVSPTGFAIPANGGPELVTFDIQDADVRVRWDGTDPTSTVGHILPATTAYTWAASQFNRAKFILSSTATTDAVIFASAIQS